MSRGHLKKRARDSWSGVVDEGRDPVTGRRRQHWFTVKGTKKDAERRLSEMLHQLNTGSFVKPTKLTLGKFLSQWYRDYVTTNVRQSTGEGYLRIIENHLIPLLGRIPIHDSLVKTRFEEVPAL